MATISFEPVSSTPRHVLNASFGELDKISFDDHHKKSRIDQIFQEISKTEIRAKGYNPDEFYCRIDWGLETVTLISKDQPQRKISVSLGDSSLHTSDKIRILVREGKNLLFSQQQLKKIKLPEMNSLGLPKGATALSSRDSFSSPFDSFEKTIPFVNAEYQGLSLAQKFKFHKKLQLTIKFYQKLKELFDAPPSNPALEGRFKTYKEQLVRLATEQQRIENELATLELRSTNRDIEDQIRTKTADLTFIKGEIATFKETELAIEAEYGNHVTLLEYQRLFKSIDFLALVLNLLHSHLESEENGSTKKIMQTLSSNQHLLNKPASLFARFMGWKSSVSQELLRDYAIDIESLSKRDYESKALHYFHHHKAYKESAKPEELILSLVHNKLNNSPRNLISIDPRLEFLTEEFARLDVALDEEILFDTTSGDLKNFQKLIADLK